MESVALNQLQKRLLIALINKEQFINFEREFKHHIHEYKTPAFWEDETRKEVEALQDIKEQLMRSEETNELDKKE